MNEIEAPVTWPEFPEKLKHRIWNAGDEGPVRSAEVAALLCAVQACTGRGADRQDTVEEMRVALGGASLSTRKAGRALALLKRAGLIRYDGVIRCWRAIPAPAE